MGVSNKGCGELFCREIRRCTVRRRAAPEDVPVLYLRVSKHPGGEVWQEKLPTKVPNVTTIDIETGHAIRQLVDLALVPLEPADILTLG